MDKAKPKGNKSTPAQFRNNGKVQGNGTQQRAPQQRASQQSAPQQKNAPQKSTRNSKSPPSSEQTQRSHLQRHHTSKTKTPLRQPRLSEPKAPPGELRKSVDVRVAGNTLEEQQPGMALLTPHGRYRHHSRVVAYIDIVASIIYMIYVVVSIALMFNEESFVTDALVMSIIIFGALTIIFIFFELCITVGLIRSTDPQLNRYDALEKAGCWRYYEFFMAAFSILYASLSIYAGYPVSGSCALVLLVMRCVGIIIVIQYIRDLDHEGEHAAALVISSMQAKKRQNHELLDVVSAMPKAY